MLLLVLASRAAFANTLVVGLGDSGNNFPFNLAGAADAGVTQSQRYQQLYSSSQFAAMAGGAWITELDFRVYAGGPSFSSVLPDVQINLSTSPKTLNTLSFTYWGNVGADDLIVVPRGPLALSGTGGPGPNPFDIRIQLTQPFFYNPANGNLLLDVRNYGGGATTFFDADRFANSIMNRVYNYSGTADSTTAEVIGGGVSGLVTQFQFTLVPEPTAASLLAIGAFAFCKLAKRKP